MPRQPDPDLEDRILNAAHMLWKRGGEKSLTMRAVARAAGTNTPAVYRRFKDRKDLVRGLLRRIATRIRRHFEPGKPSKSMAEAYVDSGLQTSARVRTVLHPRARNESPEGTGVPADPGIPAEFRFCGTIAGRATGRFRGRSHSVGAGHMVYAPWDDHAVIDESDSQRPCGRDARGVPVRGEGIA